MGLLEGHLQRTRTSIALTEPFLLSEITHFKTEPRLAKFISHEYSQNLHKQVGESVFFRMADTVNSDISLIAAGGTNQTLMGSSPDSEFGNGRRRGPDTPGL